MEILRKLVNWVSRHGILAAFGVLAVVGVAYLSQLFTARSDGVPSAPLKRGAIVDAVYGIGTVTATRSYSIKPGVITTIQDLFVKEGDTVAKGGRIARIENVIYTAPFTGVVNFLPFKVGENIFTQIPAVVLTDLLDRYVVVSMEQQGALRVKPGQQAMLSFDSLRQKTFEGVVKSVYSYNSNFLARIDVAGFPPEILPDMTADVAIIIRKLENKLVIPVPAFENGYVWVKNGHVMPVKVPVTLGVVDGAMAEVTEGELKEGDVILTRRKVGP